MWNGVAGKKISRRRSDVMGRVNTFGKYGEWRFPQILLQKKAVDGTGPPFKKLGKWPYYDTDDLDAYAEARLGGSRRSTSQTP
jgi:hypothetical protein